MYLSALGKKFAMFRFFCAIRVCLALVWLAMRKCRLWVRCSAVRVDVGPLLVVFSVVVIRGLSMLLVAFAVVVALSRVLATLYARLRETTVLFVLVWWERLKM